MYIPAMAPAIGTATAGQQITGDVIKLACGKAVMVELEALMPQVPMIVGSM